MNHFSLRLKIIFAKSHPSSHWGNLLNQSEEAFVVCFVFYIGDKGGGRLYHHHVVGYIRHTSLSEKLLHEGVCYLDNKDTAR